MTYGGQATRTRWYDRKPSIVSAFSDFTGGGPLFMTSWTYTVPAKRKCLIESLFLQLIRLTAPSVLAGAFTGIYRTPFFSGFHLQVMLFDATIGAQAQETLGAQMMLGPGEGFFALFRDQSPDGTLYFSGGFKGTEYDQ